MAKVDHPHVVPIYDVGNDGDELTYIVCKFIDGAVEAAAVRASFRVAGGGSSLCHRRGCAVARSRKGVGSPGRETGEHPRRRRRSRLAH